MVKEKERIGSIDLLRVIAIVLIIAFHYLYYINPNNSLRIIGFIGISLFFIISGFILAKRYSELENFSIKWLFKRYIKIASLYYIALIVLVIVLGRQIYSGSLLKNLFLHFVFLDFLSKDAAYGIISTAWFLMPLIGLYILYPYLNRLIKKIPYSIIIIFFIMILIRILDKTLAPYTFYSPIFFIGEFCFGIAFAYNRKILPLIAAIIVIFIKPFMFLPFLIFYLTMMINIKPYKMLVFLGANAFALFLFHEALINIRFGKWHIYTLNPLGGFVFLAIIMVLSVYASQIIQYLFYHKVLRENIKTEKSKTYKRKKSGNMEKNKNILLVAILIILVIFFIYVIITPKTSQTDKLSSLFSSKGNIFQTTSKPVLIVSDVKTNHENCDYTISGKIENTGDKEAENVFIRCFDSVYPLTYDSVKEAGKSIGLLKENQESEFIIIIKGDCSESRKARFECSSDCDNC